MDLLNICKEYIVEDIYSLCESKGSDLTNKIYDLESEVTALQRQIFNSVEKDKYTKEYLPLLKEILDSVAKLAKIK